MVGRGPGGIYLNCCEILGLAREVSPIGGPIALRK